MLTARLLVNEELCCLVQNTYIKHTIGQLLLCTGISIMQQDQLTMIIMLYAADFMFVCNLPFIQCNAFVIIAKFTIICNFSFVLIAQFIRILYARF